MNGSGTLVDKRKLASLTIVQLSAGMAEVGEMAFQIVVSPSNAEYPKRTITVGQADAAQFCSELEALIPLMRAAMPKL